MHALIVVRHGYQLGGTLTEDGRKKSEKLAELLALEIGNAEVRILTSNYGPAKDTASILATRLHGRVRTWNELSKLTDIRKGLKVASRCWARLGRKNALILVLGNTCCPIPLGDKQILWYSQGLFLDPRNFFKLLSPYRLSTDGAGPPG